MTKQKFLDFLNHSQLMSLLAMLIVVPLVFYTYTHDVFEFNKLTAFRIFTLLALLAFMARVLLLGGVAWRPSSLWPPLALVGLSSLLSTLWTNNLQTSIFGVYEDFEGILTIANYLLLWILIHQFVRNLNDARKFLGAVVLAGVLAGGYGVAQNFGIDFIMWNPNTYSASRLFGSLGNPNFLAAYLLMSLPVAFVLFLNAKGPRNKSLLLAAVMIMAVSILFTKSRGALYALVAEAALFGLYLWFDGRRPGNLWKQNQRWLMVLGLLAGLTLFSPYVRSTITTTVTRTLATLDFKHIKITPRLYIWRSALQMIRDKPVLGSGLDTFQITFPKYRLAEYWRLEWNGTPEKAHNFFLQIGATTGLLGLGAWLWLLAVYFAVLWKQIRNLSPERAHLTAAIGIAQVGFLVQNQFSFTVVAYGSLFWALLALGPTLGREEAPERVTAAEGDGFSLAEVPLNRWLGFLAVGGLILVSLVLSLRYWTADIFFKRGIIFMSRGYPQQSLAELGRAVALNPNREIYWVKYGIAYEEAAKRAQDKVALLERAADVHRHTMGMNRLNGYDFNNLGRVLKYWGDFADPAKLKEAEVACRQASELDPYNVYFALDLASVHLSQKRWPEAEKITDRLIEIFPDFAIPYSYKGYVALVQGESDKAYELFNLAAARNWRGDVTTRSTTMSNLGIVRARRGELESAVEAFDTALQLKPHYLEARLNKALILERQGLGLAAAQEYRYILQQAPQYPRAGELQRKIEILERGATP